MNFGINKTFNKMKKIILSTLVFVTVFLVLNACSTPKPAGISKEKQEQIDKDKKDFDAKH